MNGLEQRFPTILVPGTGFVEDNFSTWHREGGGHDVRMTQVHCIYCAHYLHYYYISSPLRSSGRRPQRLGTPGWEEAGMNVITDTTGTFYQTMSQIEN